MNYMEEVILLKFLLQGLWVGVMKIKKKAKQRGFLKTKQQLKKWNIKYHKLIFGKPSYDLFIDDRSIFFKKNWVKKIDDIV